uniref:Uncharacterized protein n=1 Tax=Ditylenchus dipsaci TaxID=166011 RepID=A0A915EBQ0_9BILA
MSQHEMQIDVILMRISNVVGSIQPIQSICLVATTEIKTEKRGRAQRAPALETSILLIPFICLDIGLSWRSESRKHRLIYYEFLLGDGHICLLLIN